MNIARTVLAAMALVGAAGSAHAATSIVSNGSFETVTNINGIVQVNAGQPGIANWTVGSFGRFDWFLLDGL